MVMQIGGTVLREEKTKWNSSTKGSAWWKVKSEKKFRVTRTHTWRKCGDEVGRALEAAVKSLKEGGVIPLTCSRKGHLPMSLWKVLCWYKSKGFPHHSSRRIQGTISLFSGLYVGHIITKRKKKSLEQGTHWNKPEVWADVTALLLDNSRQNCIQKSPHQTLMRETNKTGSAGSMKAAGLCSVTQASARVLGAQTSPLTGNLTASAMRRQQESLEGSRPCWSNTPSSYNKSAGKQGTIFLFGPFSPHLPQHTHTHTPP